MGAKLFQIVQITFGLISNNKCQCYSRHGLERKKKGKTRRNKICTVKYSSIPYTNFVHFEITECRKMHFTSLPTADINVYVP